jgi:hypothetical protein
MFGHYMQGSGKLPNGAGFWQADPCPSNASIVRRAAAASSACSAGCTPPRGPPLRLLCRSARKAVATWIELGRTIDKGAQLALSTHYLLVDINVSLTDFLFGDFPVPRLSP